MTSLKEPVQRVPDGTAPINYKYQHEHIFRTDLIDTLRGIEDALGEISEHLARTI
tara:strand:+ start:12156 stop:12320 length:165 start_codon:yes stop_codon:yes gene_type:complete